MGLFETQPWLLIPLIVFTIEGWRLFKKAVVRVKAASERSRS